MKNNSSQTTRHSSPVTSHRSLVTGHWSLIFFGDDDYSLTVLKAIVRGQSLHDSSVKAVITRPPKPVGRKQILTPSPVELFAKEHNIPVIHYQKSNISTLNPIIGGTPTTSKGGIWGHQLSTINSQLIGVLASFGYILPKSILDSIPHGIINIHPSLLPQYRGSTPVQHAIALGDKETGVTLFKLTPEIDKGEIIAQETEPILPTDTTPILTHRLFIKGTQILINFLQDLKLPRRPGNEVTVAEEKFYDLQEKKHNLIYTKRFTRQTGFVPWENFYAMMENQPLPVKNLQNPLLRLRAKIEKCKMINENWLKDLVRALDPWPSVWTVASTTKGPLRVKLEIPNPLTSHLSLLTKISGKPNPIPWSDFKKYYVKM